MKQKLKTKNKLLIYLVGHLHHISHQGVLVLIFWPASERMQHVFGLRHVSRIECNQTKKSKHLIDVLRFEQFLFLFLKTQIPRERRVQ